MRTVFLQSKSKSSTPSSDEDNNSCYFPGCKKDANCNCEMCLASINATLDLMPNSVHKSTLTKLSASKPNVERTPISFDASILSTPRSSEFQLSSSTPLSNSRARSDLSQKMEKHKKGQQASGFSFLRLMLFFGFFLSADLVFPLVVSGVLQPALSPNVVKKVGEKYSLVRDLNGKLRLLQKELATVVGEVSNCSFTDTLWEISQVLYYSLRKVSFFMHAFIDTWAKCTSAWLKLVLISVL